MPVSGHPRCHCGGIYDASVGGIHDASVNCSPFGSPLEGVQDANIRYVAYVAYVAHVAYVAPVAHVAYIAYVAYVAYAVYGEYVTCVAYVAYVARVAYVAVTTIRADDYYIVAEPFYTPAGCRRVRMFACSRGTPSRSPAIYREQYDLPGTTLPLCVQIRSWLTVLGTAAHQCSGAPPPRRSAPPKP